ncbi:MAG: ATP-binding protein [Pseudomonadota bacterium]
MNTANRWAVAVSGVAITGAALVLAFMLVLATNNRAAYEEHFVWLFWVNVVIASLLGLVILLASIRLGVRLLRGKFGSRLLLKLAGIFALVGVLPGALIYTVSYQFVERSIESWFDVRVEGALEAGINLGRSTLDTLSQELSSKTRLAAERLAEDESAGLAVSPLLLERVREQLGARSVALLDRHGQAVARVGLDPADTALGRSAPQPGEAGGGLRLGGPGGERPVGSLLREARLHSVIAVVEGLDDDAAPGAAADLRIRAIARIPARLPTHVPAGSFSLDSAERYLLVVQHLPATLAADAQAVQSAYREYQQRALARDGLRKMYIGTLTLALILAVFGALLLAALLGQQLAKPLLLLAEGVGEVARGDLRPKAVFTTRDELGGLTRSFAAMTQQLADARNLAERSVRELDAARANLQTILDNLSAGVIVFDAQGRIEMVNPGATRILRLPLSAYRGRALAEVPGLADFARAVDERFATHAGLIEPADRTADTPVSTPTPTTTTAPTSTPAQTDDRSAERAERSPERGDWQESYDLQLDPAQDPLTLLVRGAALPGAARLIVFDDISEVVSAQRAEAWSEVARRLAHEIKNPLTPIQLSAERLQHKLETKLEGTDRNMLVRSVGTIVDQVQAMKQLVNEFRDYARLPTARLQPVDLNALVADVLHLYGNEADAGVLVADCTSGLPLIQGDPTLLRQVVHNLVQNALDAVAERPAERAAHEPGHVCVRTSLKRDEQGQPQAVRLTVVDNGPGFADKLLKRAFEPYVTTKSKGTGLGLAVVKKIADEHGAVVRLRNRDEALADDGQGPVRKVAGAQVSISFSRLSPVAPAASHTPRAPGAAPLLEDGHP